MKRRFSMSTRGLLALAAATFASMAPFAAESAAQPLLKAKANAAAPADANSPILPVQSNAYGRSLAEWSTQFWRWEFSLPTTAHPLFDTADCSAGQSGQVWFLGGTFGATPGPPGITLGKAERWCTIPTGTALFFPVINAECSTVQGDCEVYNPYPPSEAVLRNDAMSFANLINPSTLSVTIDNTTLHGMDLYRYRVQSPLFQIGPLPNNNIFQMFGLYAPSGSTWQAVSDGVHVMLHPLSAGIHTLKFTGELDFPDGSKFIEDITYHLTVR